MKLYEVQTYLSMTNHWWSGFTFTASTKAWDTLPKDMKDVVEKHAKTMALAQRKDVDELTKKAVDILKSKGMIVNECDTSGFKKPLAGFYARWKAVYGDKAWTILEKHVGKLV
jgi:TRAP-type C4-dicarboxylate transport system substrate-binding protein